MKNGDVFKGEQVEDFIPHRGINMLLDEIEFYEDRDKLMSRSWLDIRKGAGDPRELFLLQSGDSWAYSEFFLVEHVALTSSVQIYPNRKDGDIAFFSTITSFRLENRIPEGAPVVADVEPLGNRGPFHRSACSIRSGSADSPLCCYSELMAALVPASSGDSQEGEKKTVRPPEIVEVRPVERGLFGFKDPRMIFVDEETAIDQAKRRLTARYLYPTDHPLVPGHFPGNPIMMGVAQWSGLMDCAVWLHHRLGLQPGDFRADGEILRLDGTLVTEVKGLVVRIPEDGSAPLPLATRRIGFRDMVRAGEEIFYTVGLSPA